MFQHDEYFQVNDEDTVEEEENDEREMDEEINSDSIHLSEIEPVLLKVGKAIEKVTQKFDKCEFTAKNQNGLNMHIKAKHADKSS